MNISSLYAPVHVDGSSVIGEYCVLGYPKEARLKAEQQKPGSEVAGDQVLIGPNCLVGNHVAIHEGVRVASGCVIEDRVRIGYDTSVGADTRIVYGAYVCDRVVIGEGACVAGFVCDGTVIGDRSTVMGELVHEYTRPHDGWWGVDEAPPVIEADSVVGYGARIVGGVRVGPRSYVAAGAVVTKDVPPGHVVTGVNVLTPTERWSGRRLQSLIRHWESLAKARMP